jgi:hypothetical protein
MTTDDRSERSHMLPTRLSVGWQLFNLENLTIALIAGITFALRSYRLAATPLWLDEIYGYQLGQLGIGAIFNNSLGDPHPPLYYLIQWITSGFGVFHTEWAWRWLAVVTGALTVLLTYRLARIQGVGPIAALLSCTLFAICPTHIYFSQEARPPAIAVCLSAVTTLLMWRIRSAPQQRSRWLTYTLVSLLGLYINYSFVLVVGVQLLYMFLFLQLYRRTLIYGCLILSIFVPIAVIGSRAMVSIASGSSNGSALTAIQAVQSLLGGDLARYGLSWTHSWLAAMVCILLLAGLWAGYRQGIFVTTTYYALQIAVPFIGFFGFLSPVLHINLPLSEAKNFMFVLPPVFVLAAQGIQQLVDYTRRNVTSKQAIGASSAAAYVDARAVFIGIGLLGAYASLIYASGLNLQRYWNTTKSPEGLAVLDVRDHILPDDIIISEHYSLDAALSFYLPDVPHYTKPQFSSGSYLFSQSLSILHARPIEQASIPLNTIIGKHPRIWLLSLAPSDAKLVKKLGQFCALGSQQLFGPFRVTLLENCNSDTKTQP